MERLESIKRLTWAWIGFYAIAMGIMMGYSFGGQDYLGIWHFSTGAMFITILLAIPMLAPVVLLFSAIGEIVRQQEIQSSALVRMAASQDAPRPPAATTTRSGAAKRPAADASAAEPTVSHKVVRKTGWKSPYS